MKILAPGTPQQRELPWWCGKPITCEKCGRSISLEPEDERNVPFMAPALIVIPCANCGMDMKLQRERIPGLPPGHYQSNTPFKAPEAATTWYKLHNMGYDEPADFGLASPGEPRNEQ